MPVKASPVSDAARVAELRAVLQRDLDQMLQWRGPVEDVRRLLAEIDALAEQTASARPEACQAEDRVPDRQSASA